MALADVHSGYLYSYVRTPLPHGVSKLLFKYVSNILYSFQDIFLWIHCAILEEMQTEINAEDIIWPELTFFSFTVNDFDLVFVEASKHFHYNKIIGYIEYNQPT